MVEVREVTIDEILKVHSAIVEFDDTRDVGADYFVERYENKDPLLIVGYIDDQPAGYIVGYNRDNDSTYYCWMAGVDPKFRRQGVLTTLMDYEDEWARRKGYHGIKIKTRNNKRQMIANLVKRGFNFVEVEPRDDIRENRILLVKEF
jgi:ribosomal protein S18 acetylase RimI-like enzyme